jgi:hypothetical protein
MVKKNLTLLSLQREGVTTNHVIKKDEQIIFLGDVFCLNHENCCIRLCEM